MIYNTQVEETKSFTIQGGTFTQSSGMLEITSIYQAMEALANHVCVMHRICPANSEALVLFMAAFRSFITKSQTILPVDLKTLFVDWNVERNNRITNLDGMVSYKWCEVCIL